MFPLSPPCLSILWLTLSPLSFLCHSFTLLPILFTMLTLSPFQSFFHSSRLTFSPFFWPPSVIPVYTLTFQAPQLPTIYCRSADWLTGLRKLATWHCTARCTLTCTAKTSPDLVYTAPWRNSTPIFLGAYTLSAETHLSMTYQRRDFSVIFIALTSEALFWNALNPHAINRSIPYGQSDKKKFQIHKIFTTMTSRDAFKSLLNLKLALAWDWRRGRYFLVKGEQDYQGQRKFNLKTF